MKTATAFCLSLFLFTLGAARAGAAPSLVYSTQLGGEVLDVAVDSAGNAIVLGSRDSHFDYFLAKLSPLGELIFLRPLELPLEPSMKWRELSAVALDPAGYIYITGTADFDNCLGQDPQQCSMNDSHLGFVAKLGPDGTGLFYDTIFWEAYESHGLDLAVDALGRAHVLFTIRWEEYGDTSAYGVSFSPAGSRQGDFGYATSAWFSYVNAMAMGPSGDLFTVGWQYPDSYSYAIYLQRTDASSGAVVETLLDDSGTIALVDVAGTPGGGSVVVGEFWPPSIGGFYIAEFGPAGEEVFSRVLNLGVVEVRDVAVTSSGQIVVVGHTGSGSLVLWLEGGTGEVISSMILGDDARAVAVGPGGDAYVAFDDSVARISENRPPDCSAATAGPSVIWPPNGKMIPVSILGATDPDSDPVTIRVTGISQDEPGAAFSGIGSSVAQVKAERDGKGDGRVYRIEFQAIDPSGTSCAGEVTVCVPHDRGKGSCVDGGALVSSSR